MTPQPKPERIRDTAYMRWIKILPCLVQSFTRGPEFDCGYHDFIDPHHVVPPGGGKTGSKVDDRRTVPLCRKHHDEAQRGREAFEKKYFLWLAGEILRLNREYNSAHPPKPQKQIQGSKVYGLKVKCSCRKVHVIPLSKAVIGKKSVSFTCATRNTRERLEVK